MSDEELWTAFLNGTLTSETWTHRAHVRIGFMHIKQLPFQEALALVRTRIRQLNAALGTPDAIDRGYHETITHAFLKLITAAAQQETISDSEAFCTLHPELLDKRILLQYYSRDRLMSMDAKTAFIEPDLRPLPVLLPWKA